MSFSSAEMDTDRLQRISRESRELVLKLGFNVEGGAHFGPAMSLVEILTVLIQEASLRVFGEPDFELRDRIILSKGHGSLALYAALFQRGFISKEVLLTCEQDGSRLPGQPIRDLELGIEFSSGSLGMGLGYGIGLALDSRMRGFQNSVYVVVGDGETNEGSVWEAVMLAGQLALSNLVMIVDVNRMQSDGSTAEILDTNLSKTLTAFGWQVQEVDGHSVSDLSSALRSTRQGPTAILARTVKGRGVSFMENSVDWHHGKLTRDEFETAMAELDAK